MLLATSKPVPNSARLLPGAWRQIVAAIAALLLFGMWMAALGRPLVCPCGAVRLWAPEHDSQHVSDWYSLLHVSFGLGLFAVVHRFQPSWSAGAKALAALVSSLVWEAIENLPAVIALFGVSADGQIYRGDTILNALGDTVAVLAGFALAARLPGWGVAALLLAIEFAVGLAIGDGLIIGSVRLLLG